MLTYEISESDNIISKSGVCGRSMRIVIGGGETSLGWLYRNKVGLSSSFVGLLFQLKFDLLYQNICIKRFVTMANTR